MQWIKFTEQHPEERGLIVVYSDTHRWGEIYFPVDFKTGWGVYNLKSPSNRNIAWCRLEKFEGDK